MILSARVNTFGQDLLRRHGERVHKIALDAGFTCPNRDGTKGRGGCSFCNNVSFSPDADTRLGLAAQIAKARLAIARRTRARKFIAYYQAYTNTYAKV
jgi:radical SAM superfamily enzyme